LEIESILMEEILFHPVLGLVLRHRFGADEQNADAKPDVPPELVDAAFERKDALAKQLDLVPFGEALKSKFFGEGVCVYAALLCLFSKRLVGFAVQPKCDWVSHTNGRKRC